MAEKSKVAEREEKILKFWQENKIFEKSLEKPLDSARGEFVFYDGPPFATGLPHYGHILPGTIKDVIPRYKTMQGYHVARRWGWDCHGLPVENLVENELKFKTKKDILNYGVDKFNQAARATVGRYEDDWKRLIPRTGRWVDMEHPYRTMDPSYTESIWWVFKLLYDKSLIYKGYKSMHLCPRCETTLSNFEVTQGYKDVTDTSVYVKFELVDESGTYFLAWTTTAWTLPGNSALAVGSEIEYVKVKISNENYILAKAKLSELGVEYQIVDEFKGRKLVGKKYKPLFNFTKGAFEVYSAEFVTLDEGTGVVHVAPAFGEEDMTLAKKYNIPLIQHVTMDGHFKPEVKGLAGESVFKNKIIETLGDKIFKTASITHSYPHCWRCETRLLNYAADSWFVAVEKIKGDLVANNKKTKWVPEHIRDGRFGKWLEGARDWAISRSRFWGAPLPVWECADCKKQKVIGSLEELKSATKKSGNKYWVMRHGEAESNIKNIMWNSPEGNHLTEYGVSQVREAAKKIKNLGIDMIVSSDLVRTKETSALVAQEIGIQEISHDLRLREINVGDLEGHSVEEYWAYTEHVRDRFTKRLPNGENYTDVKKRVGDFIYDLDNKFAGKKILIVTHDSPAWLLFAAAHAQNVDQTTYIHEKLFGFMDNAEVRELDFQLLPHNENYELDLHLPYIDQIQLMCECGGEMRRVLEVFDCWFESGSMPYAQLHYPFENENYFKDHFPADFIAEGQDQTRGWFYSMSVLGTALFGSAPFKNVVVNGLVLAEDGAKMSKRLKNYPELDYILDKYGADALRLYLMSSSAVHAEDLNFSEHGVKEVQNKVINRLDNVVSFFELYSDVKHRVLQDVKHSVLDRWVFARLNQLITEVTNGLDAYELDKAARPIADFVDDLSTWYLRRSRERIKIEGGEILRSVLLELSKIMAPFTPFQAEDIYKRAGGELESVHLEMWPKAKEATEADEARLNDEVGQAKKLIEQMQQTRDLVEKALAARDEAKVKVRQPLAVLKTKVKLPEEFLDLVRDEVNVKKVEYDEKLESDVWLDTNITPELKEEGQLRDLVRDLQDQRKKLGLKPGEPAALKVSKSLSDLVAKHDSYLKKTASVTNFEFE